MRPRIALFAAALALAACQNGVPSASIIVTSGVARVSPTVVPTPRPTFTPTPRPLLPRDEVPPLPPTTPAPVPSLPTFGDGVGGPTPSPAPSLIPGLTLVVGSQAPDTWLAGPPLNRPRAGLAAGVVDGVIVAVEGAPQPSVETLGPLVNAGSAWRLNDRHDPHVATGTYLTAGISLMGAAATAGALYTLGGSDGGPTAAVSRYGVNGYVDRVATLPLGVRAPACGQIGDLTIVAGGLGATGPLDTVRRLRINAGTSEAGTAMPQAVAGAAAAVFEGKLWLMGGYEADRFGQLSPITRTMVYDPVANSWRASADAQADPPPPLPDARHSAAAAVLDGKLYVAGGAGAGGGLLGTVFVLDRSGQPPVWKAVAGLPTARALFSLVAHDGRLWALGGRTVDGQASTIVEIYRP